MLPMYLLTAAILLAGIPAAHAQAVARQRPEQVEQRGPDPEPRVAIPRSAAPRPAPEAAPPPAPSRLEPSPRDGGDQGRAVPRSSRPRGENPPVGAAVPRGQRQTPPVPAPPADPARARGRDRDRDRDRNIVVTRPPVYNNYYYYPYSYSQRSYPYGYGSFGLGYFYYDPYRWYPRSYYGYNGGGFYGGGFYDGVFRSGRSSYGGSYFDIGELRLQVSPRHAQVFVDGYYAGMVDDYDGAFQAIKMESGPYRIEIVAPGYETLEFNVRIIPGQKISYRGDLVPIRP